jgi:hypothetical protein
MLRRGWKGRARRPVDSRTQSDGSNVRRHLALHIVSPVVRQSRINKIFNLCDQLMRKPDRLGNSRYPPTRRLRASMAVPWTWTTKDIQSDQPQVQRRAPLVRRSPPSVAPPLPQAPPVTKQENLSEDGLTNISQASSYLRCGQPSLLTLHTSTTSGLRKADPPYTMTAENMNSVIPPSRATQGRQGPSSETTHPRPLCLALQLEPHGMCLTLPGAQGAPAALSGENHGLGADGAGTQLPWLDKRGLSVC